MAKKINVEKKARSDIYKGNDLFPSLAYAVSSIKDDLSRQLYTLWYYYFSFWGKTKSTSCTSNTLMILYKVFNQLAVFSTKGSPQNAIQKEKRFLTTKRFVNPVCNTLTSHA